MNQPSGIWKAWRITRALVLVGGLFTLMASVVVGIVFGLTALWDKVIVGWLDAPGAAISGTHWVGVLVIVAVGLVLVMITAALLTVAERKWSARMQNRLGPNRARIHPRMGAMWGVPHLVADAVKMLTKEDFVPPSGAAFLFNLAPVMAFAPAFALVAVVPFGPDFEAFGLEVRLQGARLDFGLLWIFAIASLAVYGTTLAGWASNNKFSLLGALRASAQMISYEVTLGLTLVGVFMLFATLRPEEIVAWQSGTVWGVVPKWGVFYQPFAFVFFLVAAFAEVKRAPFDLPEGESEILGYFVEYSGMKFGLFMISEFAEIVILSGVITAIFFGGWSVPWVSWSTLGGWLIGVAGQDWGTLLAAVAATAVFIGKMMFFVWLQMLIRWSFPRFRYDQVMDLGWKILLPLSLGNVIVTAVVIVLDPTLQLALVVGLVQAVILVAFFLTAAAPDRDEVPGGDHDAHAPAH